MIGEFLTIGSVLATALVALYHAVQLHRFGRQKILLPRAEMVRRAFEDFTLWLGTALIAMVIAMVGKIDQLFIAALVAATLIMIAYISIIAAKIHELRHSCEGCGLDVR